jgi:hypothetical protein
VTLTHLLLAAAMVLCSVPAIAQDGHANPERVQSPPDKFLPAAAAPSEPWRIIPDQVADAGSEKDSANHIRIDQFRLDRPETELRVRAELARAELVRALDTDVTCYAIRSYVVERDSKDSDSTHPAGYSTCQPSQRYQVRSAEMRAQASDH